MPRGVYDRSTKTKAPKAPKAPVVHPLGDAVDGDGFYCIKGELLWKYRAASSEFENTQLRLARNKEALIIETSKHPEIKALRDEQAALLGASSLALKELEEVQKQISGMLGVDLKNCGIDDKTGRIHVVDSLTGKTEPLAPKKSTKKANRRSAGTATT